MPPEIINAAKRVDHEQPGHGLRAPKPVAASEPERQAVPL